MTIYKSGACYYACVDGEKSWKQLYGNPPIEIEDMEFVHCEADYTCVYGGIVGYGGNMDIESVRKVKTLTIDKIVKSELIEEYDIEEPMFNGLRLLVKDGNNFILCRHNGKYYGLYDNKGNLLGDYDTSMDAVAYLSGDADQGISYKQCGGLTFYVIRIGDVYYSYSRYDNFNDWRPVLNMHFENKPVGFALEDGQVMEACYCGLYLVNGGEKGYVNVPMFYRMDYTQRIGFAQLSDDISAKKWVADSLHVNGTMYEYNYDQDEYVIFCLNDVFYVYRETNGDMESSEFVGVFSDAEETDNAICK